MTRKASHMMVAPSAADALPFTWQSDRGGALMCVIAKGYHSMMQIGSDFRIPD